MQKRDEFLDANREPNFWEIIKKNGRLTLFFIADYWGFREYVKRLIVRLCGIHSSYLIIMSLGNDYTKYCDIVESRWNFIQTESMGFAYSLSPSHADSMDKVGTDGIDTITQLRKDATKIFGTESGDKFNQELNGFLTLFTVLDTKRKNQFCELAPLHYWLIHGRIDFPMSAEIVICVYNTPVSNAASERTWSSFDFIHTKKRTRLVNEKVRKLVFFYANYSMLHPKDDKDY